MYILALLLSVWWIYGLWNYPKNGQGTYLCLSSFNRQTCASIRGVLAIMIVLHHLFALYGDSYPYLSQASFWGTSVCIVFFFFSGYGLMSSYTEKGRLYLNSFFPKRVFNLVLPVLIVVIVDLLLRILTKQLDTDALFHSMLNGIPVLPHLWFVAVLFYFYIWFYFSARFLTRNLHIIISITVGYIISVLLFKYLGWGNYWHDSSCGFLLGLVLAAYNVKVNDWLMRQKYPYVLASCIIFSTLLYCTVGQYTHVLPAWGSLFCLSFPFVVVICLLLCPISNKVLVFLGGISFEIYLVHVTIMRLMHSFLHQDLIFLVSVCCLVVVTAFLLSLFGKWVKHLCFE